MSRWRVRRLGERGRDAAGRLWATVARRSPPAAADPAELEAALRRARRLRRRLRAAESEARLLREELARTRDSVRDPFPGLVVQPEVADCIQRVRDEHLTYLSRGNLEVLARLAMEADLAGRDGVLVEAGTARGGSAIVMAAAKSRSRRMLVYDVFGMIPPPSDRDGADVHARYGRILRGQSKGVGGDVYYGYREDLLGEVTDSFARLGHPVDEAKVSLVQGLFQDTIDLDEPVALAHLDGDWYESTRVCLERIAPLLVPGGRIVLDDYYAWSGCRVAVDEYFEGRRGYRVERRTKLHVVRQ